MEIVNLPLTILRDINIKEISYLSISSFDAIANRKKLKACEGFKFLNKRQFYQPWYGQGQQTLLLAYHF